MQSVRCSLCSSSLHRSACCRACYALHATEHVLCSATTDPAPTCISLQSGSIPGFPAHKYSAHLRLTIREYRTSPRLSVVYRAIPEQYNFSFDRNALRETSSLGRTSVSGAGCWWIYNLVTSAATHRTFIMTQLLCD